jgi:hypothetical protein
MKEQIYLGAIDNQSVEQKERNYKLEEVVTASTPVIWLEKTQDQWKKLPAIRDQDGSGQCVAMTLATEMSIIFEQKYGTWIDFSSSFPYQQRTQPMVSGCNSTDIFSVFPKIGNVFEKDMPSQKMSDAQAMAVKKEKYFDDLAKTYCVKRIELPLDFEEVASTIQATGKGVMVWFKFHPSEWTDKPTIGTKPWTSGHSVTAIDYFLYNNKKYLLIVDSWGKNYAIQGYRLISEEYFNARCFLASYLMTFKPQDNSTVQERPKFDGSIISAQKCFKWEGLMAGNIPEIKNWGNITRTACIAFQKRYNIEPAEGNFGPLTKKQLTKLYP